MSEASTRDRAQMRGERSTPAPRRRRGGAAVSWGLMAVVLGCLVLRRPITAALDGDRFLTWATVFVALIVQAAPFLVFGVLLAALIATFLPAEALNRMLPRNSVAAVPVATTAGALLPGCECASVPIANSLMRRGIAPAAALAFLLSAPAINPIVLVSTAVAFPGRPEIVLGRFLASWLVAVLLGLLWLRFGKAEWLHLSRPHVEEGASRLRRFQASMQHDFLHAGGFLVVGAAIAASVNTLMPRTWLDTVADNWLLSILALALAAFLIAICSEADAFIAASFVGFSDTAKLAFMVVGPAIDVKLASMQAGTFGGRFAVVFGTATFVVAVAVSALVGWWLL